jgi:hypothetical protein
MGIVSQVLADRIAADSAAGQKTLDTRAKVIAVILADSQGQAPRASARLLHAAIDSGVISADECERLQDAAEELAKLRLIESQVPERRKAAADAEREYAIALEEWRSTQSRLTRRMTETRYAATEAAVVSGRFVALKQSFPELFDTSEAATNKTQAEKPDYDFNSGEED